MPPNRNPFKGSKLWRFIYLALFNIQFKTQYNFVLLISVHKNIIMNDWYYAVAVLIGFPFQINLIPSINLADVEIFGIYLTSVKVPNLELGQKRQLKNDRFKFLPQSISGDIDLHIGKYTSIPSCRQTENNTLVNTQTVIGMCSVICVQLILYETWLS